MDKETKPATYDSVIAETATAKPSREIFIQTVREQKPENELRQALDELIHQLQQEADSAWAGPERDLWFNYHLAQTYAAAGLWEDAQNAIDNLLVVAQNLDAEIPEFEILRQKIAGKKI